MLQSKITAVVCLYSGEVVSERKTHSTHMHIEVHVTSHVMFIIIHPTHHHLSQS